MSTTLYRNIMALILSFSLILSGCSRPEPTDTLTVGVSAEYPPFEYQVDGQLQGFDIELAKLIANKLRMKIVFQNMQFSSILPALKTGSVDIAISAINMTPERLDQFAFSNPYYIDAIAVVYRTQQPITTPAALKGKRIACQLGTTMQSWLKQHSEAGEIVAMDNNNQAIEALKAGLVDAVLMDGAQASVFSKKNPGLSYAPIAKADAGYGVVLKPDSRLLPAINKALSELKASGAIQQLEKKWIGTHD